MSRLTLLSLLIALLINDIVLLSVVLFPVQAGTCPDYAQHASLHHCVAMALLSRLLPGSEHLAYEVLLDLAFSPEFLP